MRQAHIIRTAVGLQARVRSKAPGRHVGSWLNKELQQLGGALPLKMGQWASNRADLFGDELTKELTTLRDSVMPMKQSELMHVLESQNLRDSIDIDWTPVAAASIGQVHLGKLKGSDGRSVAVKVRRPHVIKHLKQDGAALMLVMEGMKRLGVPDAAEAKVLLEQLLHTFIAETDFNQEVYNMKRFPTMPFVKIPRPYENLCSEDVIVMDFIDSKPLQSVQASSSHRRSLAAKLMHTYLYQLFQTSVLHCDPHPGNFGVDTDGNFVLYDFGNVLDLTDQFKFQLKAFILAMAGQNTREAVRILEEDMNLKIIDRESLKEWLQAYFRYIKSPGLNAKASFSEITDPRRQPILFTPDLLLIVRAFSSLEGVCTSISSDFNYMSTLETFVDSILFDQEFMEQKALYDIARMLK